jgi:DNA topoisomerase-3
LKLVICEKPSVAKTIAKILGAKTQKDGFLEGGGYLVSWCFGHLVELAPPSAYGEQFKRWSIKDLPILPQQWQYAASADKAPQLEILRSLLQREDVDLVVNAGDAGREGELIFRLVYNYCGCDKPVSRLWISSMEDNAIRDGFANLKDGADYDSLYRAALCRTRADWLVGINATRLFSCLYGATLNVGRVQSPTLAMIVARKAEIDVFVKAPFYTIELDCGEFSAVSERFSDKTAAESVAENISAATVCAINRVEKTVAPPKLYDLTTLQREANRAYGSTAQQTLDCAQALYEKKLITYPRTDSRYLTDDMAEPVTALVNAIAHGAPCDAGQVLCSSKVTDHHALLPTFAGVAADVTALTDDERKVLEMLKARLVCAVGEKHRYLETLVTIDANGTAFKAKGKTVVNAGWKAYAIALTEAGTEEQSSALPEIDQGQELSVTAQIRKGTASPPRCFTEDTLLSAMETAGQEEMPEDAERKGLGTSATRAGIIEKLISGGFIERQKKNLVPTAKGVNLCAVLPEELKSPLLTAEWEQRLCAVERGKLSDADFMHGISALTSGLVAAHSAPLPEYAGLFVPAPKGDAVGKCPRCGADVLERDKGFFCARRACGFALWKNSRFWTAKGKELDKSIAAALLSKGRVSFTDFVSEKTGKAYAATVVLVDDGAKTDYRLEFKTRRRAAV